MFIPNSRSLSLRPDSETWHHLGSFYHNTGRLTEAKTAFRESLGLNPQRTETACALVSEQFSELTSLVPHQKKSSLMYIYCIHKPLINFVVKLFAEFLHMFLWHCLQLSLTA